MIHAATKTGAYIGGAVLAGTILGGLAEGWRRSRLGNPALQSLQGAALAGAQQAQYFNSASGMNFGWGQAAQSDPLVQGAINDHNPGIPAFFGFLGAVLGLVGVAALDAEGKIDALSTRLTSPFRNNNPSTPSSPSSP